MSKSKPPSESPSTIDFAALPTDEVFFENEGLFARDVNGQLIRMERADQKDFDTTIQLSIDGHVVQVKKAVPLTDSQGNIIRDASGQPTPRYTTIYDAATQAFANRPGQRNPIPTLCHQEHLPPVGVCRVCVVLAAENSKYGRRSQLVPACLQHVSDGMEVTTLESREDPESASVVREAVRTIVDLLCFDSLPTTPDGKFLETVAAGPGNELAALAARLGVEESCFANFSTPTRKAHDESGLIIDVDHSQCILCGRCSRGCNWLKGNNIIGRSQKGYASIISFDFGDPMGSSQCVSCGECATSCPTGALEFKPEFIVGQQRRVLEEMAEDSEQAIQPDDFVTPEELKSIDLFSAVPYKFLQFNASAIIRRRLKKGDMLCREGEYGASAFILREGRFDIFLGGSGGAVRTARAKGWRGWLNGLTTFLEPQAGTATLSDIGSARLGHGKTIERGPEDIILGEMSCMNRYPRSATVIAKEDGEVLEIRRNVLHMLQRNSASREILNAAYRKYALVGQLRNLPIFVGMDETERDQAAEFLQGRVDIIFVDPKQTIIAEGDVAENFYITKLGFVKVSQTYGRGDRVLDYLGPGRYFGEIGLLSKLGLIEGAMIGGRATATCSALDHVELIRIRFDDFQQLMEAFPAVRESLASRAHELLQRDEAAQQRLNQSGIGDAIEQGLYGAHNLLVLDLERCTRCDECTKACADTHDGVTRLIREGMRFDRFLVASACRSCMDPYCLVGCPVDAIHREGATLQIAIKDYCIGCGLCAQNCPYGNINMHGFPETGADGKQRVQQRATTCDLCQSIDGKPSCVYACPHDAAFRMTGEELLQMTEPAS